jgi:putative copper export protein
LPDDRRTQIETGLGRVAVAAATVLVAALLGRAWGHTAASFGPLEAFTWPSLSLMAVESDWGHRWQIQLATAITLAVVARGIPQLPSLAWPATALAAVAFCYVLPLHGHAAGEPLRVGLHGSHVLAAGLWVGTLGATALATPRGQRAEMLRAFAPIATTGVAVLGATGAVAVWLYVGSWTALVASWYGRLLILKVIFVINVGLFGFINWRQFHRGTGARVVAGDAETSSPSRGAPVVVELLLASVVVIVTAVLTELEHP